MLTVATLPSGECSHSRLFPNTRVIDTQSCHVRYIEYALRGDADEAVRKLNGTELNGVVVVVEEDVRPFPPLVLVYRRADIKSHDSTGQRSRSPRAFFALRRAPLGPRLLAPR